MPRLIHRREFLRRSSLAGVAAAGATGWLRRGLAQEKSPNEKLNIGIIGTAHRGADNVAGVQGENIVAICDVDERLLAKVAEQFPAAKRYADFRKLLDQDEIDAVVVSTPDHVHAVASVLAMKAGKHVYCEKPLAHSVSEARAAAEAAARYGLATQMGTQIHAESNYRRVVELIRAGAIGQVTDCHVWCGKTWSGGERPTEQPAVPAYLNWDLWLGPAPARPYHPTYLPANWRRWWDFGSGTLGDMACHYMDLPFWALGLIHPTTVEAEGPPVHPETTPPWLIVRYEFPARRNLVPVKLSWYDGGKQPAILDEASLPKWESGVLFIGEQGMLLADYGRRMLLPEAKFAAYEPPKPSIPDSIGHHAEWILACKKGTETTCNFDYSVVLSESVLLGNVAFRTGKKLDWDPVALAAKNCPEAAGYLEREYRRGWSLV